MYILADYEQLVGEVKERNQYHKALLEIREIASNTTSLQELNECKELFLEIKVKSDSALEKFS